jgi:hypothetical protein
LLRFELIQLSFLSLDLSLLRRQLPLHVFFLPLPGLHLIADQRSAKQSHGSANPSTGTGVTGGGADDPA